MVIYPSRVASPSFLPLFSVKEAGIPFLRSPVVVRGQLVHLFVHSFDASFLRQDRSRARLFPQSFAISARLALLFILRFISVTRSGEEARRRRPTENAGCDPAAIFIRITPG